jgi:hypothetical protein
MMRCAAFLCCLWIAGCTHHVGTKERPPRPPIDESEAHLGDDAVGALLALRAKVDAALTETEASIDSDRRDDDSLSRRLTLSVALVRIDAAIAARAAAMREHAPRPSFVDQDLDVFLASIREEIRHVRERHGRDERDDRGEGNDGGETTGMPAEDKSSGWSPPRPSVESPPPALQPAPGHGADGRPIPAGAGPVGGYKKTNTGKVKGGAIRIATVVADVDDVDRSAELSRHLPRFASCVPSHLRGEHWDVSLEGSVGVEGMFRSVRLVGGADLPANVSACLVDTLKTLRVTPPEEGVVLLKFSLELGR